MHSLVSDVVEVICLFPRIVMIAKDMYGFSVGTCFLGSLVLDWVRRFRVFTSVFPSLEGVSYCLLKSYTCIEKL